MLANTITLTVNGVAKVLVRINSSDAYASEYRLGSTTDEYRMKVRHTNTTKNGVKYDRHNVEVVHTIYAVGAVAEYSRKFYYVVELLPSDPDVFLANALCNLSIAASNLFLTQMNSWES